MLSYLHRPEDDGLLVWGQDPQMIEVESQDAWNSIIIPVWFTDWETIEPEEEYELEEEYEI